MRERRGEGEREREGGSVNKGPVGEGYNDDAPHSLGIRLQFTYSWPIGIPNECSRLFQPGSDP